MSEGLWENNWPDLNETCWKDEALTKKPPITFGTGSESWNSKKLYCSLMEMALLEVCALQNPCGYLDWETSCSTNKCYAFSVALLLLKEETTQSFLHLRIVESRLRILL